MNRRHLRKGRIVRHVAIVVAVVMGTAPLAGAGPLDEAIEIADAALCTSAGLSLIAPCADWVARYDGPASGNDQGSTAALAPDGSALYVTGFSQGEGTGIDFATVAYDTTTGLPRWTARYDGPTSQLDTASSVGVSPDGSQVFVSGRSQNVRFGIAVVAYDATDGTERWVARVDPPSGGLSGGALAVDPSGERIYVTWWVASGDPQITTAAYASADGQLLWTAGYSGPPGAWQAISSSIAGSPDGEGVYVTGWVGGPGGVWDRSYATLAYDAQTGAERWSKVTDGPVPLEQDEARALAVAPDGSRVYVTGGSTGEGTSQDYLTVAYDAGTGAELWRARYDFFDLFDQATGAAVSGDGALVYVIGSSTGFGTGLDYATVAYDAHTGVEVWTARYNGPVGLEDRPWALAVDPDDDAVYVTGQSRGVGTGTSGIVTLAYSPEGEELWQVRETSGASGIGRAVVPAPDGSALFVAGHSIGQGTNQDFVTVAYVPGLLRRLPGEAP